MTLAVVLSLAFSYSEASCIGDVPLVIPSSPDGGSVITIALYEYGVRYGLQPRDTVTCTDFLTHAPLMCDDVEVARYCCQSCSSISWRCCRDLHISIGVMNASFVAVWTYDSTQIGNDRWSGLFPDVVKELSLVMGFNYTYVPLDFGDFVTAVPVTSGVVDLSMVQVRGSYFNRITMERAPVTRAFLEFKHDIVVRRSTRGGGHWRIFAPFTRELWVFICVGIIASGFIFWLVESRYANDMQRTPAGVFGASYFAITTLLVGGEGYEVTTWLGRFLRIGTLFFVLIVNSTYTAELASILTAESRVIDGPTTLDAAKGVRVCCVLGASEASCVGESWIEPPAELLGTPGADDYCVNALRTGAVDGITVDEFQAKALLAANCDDFVHSGISYQRSDISLYVGPRIAHLVPHFSAAVSMVKSTEKWDELEKRYYPTPCAEEESGELVVDTKHMSGLFIIFACFCALVLVLFFSRTVLEKAGLWEGTSMRNEANKADTAPTEDMESNDGRTYPSITKEEVTTLLANQRKLMDVMRSVQKEIKPQVEK